MLQRRHFVIIIFTLIYNCFSIFSLNADLYTTSTTYVFKFKITVQSKNYSKKHKSQKAFFSTENILTCHKRKNTRVNRKWMTAEFHLAALVSGSWHWACLARCHDFLGIEQSYRSHYCNTCTFPTMTSQNVWAVEKRLSSQCKKLCSLGHFYSHMSLSMHLLMQIWKKTFHVKGLLFSQSEILKRPLSHFLHQPVLMHWAVEPGFQMLRHLIVFNALA